MWTNNVQLGSFDEPYDPIGDTCKPLLTEWHTFPMEPGDLENLIGNMGGDVRVVGLDEYPRGLDSPDTIADLFMDEDPRSLNLVLALAERYPKAAETVELVLDTGYPPPETLRGLAEWIAKADEFPYHGYSDGAMGPYARDTPYAITMLEELGVWHLLEETGCSTFMDLDKMEDHYAQESDLYLGSLGYLDLQEGVPRLYTSNRELEEMAFPSCARHTPGLARR